MKKLLLAIILLIPVFGDIDYPACTGTGDCAPQCTSRACNPPGVPCPQAGYPWC